jgi:hypothetical protein
LPNPGKGQKLSFHDKVAKGQRQKTMEACALAGSPSDFVKVEELSRYRKFNKWHNIYSPRLLELIIKLSRLPRQLHIPAVVASASLFQVLGVYTNNSSIFRNNQIKVSVFFRLD